MSLSPARPPRLDWRWFIAIWAIAIATLVVRSMVGRGDAPFFGDTDDAMRMVVVRDFLAGQPWYDLVQHRLNTPFGAEIHWSRLVDVPLAVLVGGFGLVLDPTSAMVAAGTVWPLVLLGVLLWLSAKIALELVGSEGLLPALVLPVLSPAILTEFTPGRVDHHSVVILLTVMALWLSLVALRRPKLGWAAGLICATTLAIAVEAIPMALAAILAFGLAYVADRNRAGAMRRFGLAFGGGLALHLALIRPPARWLEAACDMISPVYVLAGLLVAAAFTIVSWLPAPRPWQRFSLLAVFGGLAAGLVVIVYPQCLGGPYAAVDPWLQTYWLGAIVEAKPWHRSLVDLPPYTIAVSLPVMLALAVGALAFRREPEKRLGWMVLLVFLLCATAVMLAQVRGARLAFMPAVPAACWLIVTVRTHYLRRGRVLDALGLVGSWLAFSGVVLAVIATLVVNLLPGQQHSTLTAADTGLTKESCLTPAAFADLKGLPPARIMTPIDLGSHMLLETHHEVVAAPYHRNQQGVLDAFRFFNGPEAAAHKVARERGLSLLVTCPAMPEMRGVGGPPPDAIVTLLAQDRPPSWLQPVTAPGPLKVYAIAP
ncbi:hypothetical protein IC608_11360 [Devosia sp. PTR5]|uniref:Uncharacterized protein n=1 Tax=Devosia oryzisoli TaxID=2774138 RepID=A0A927FTM8_9HYPH|nr:hypothetical protein [Devosia oryzisoli]MBD8066070.1 hypothetical protein [Devosia oryzisoli]